jgi:hypothetical protein
MKHVINAFFALAEHCIPLTPDNGSALNTHVHDHVQGLFSAFSDYTHTAATIKQSDFKKALLPVTGKVYAFCDSLATVHTANEPFFYTSQKLKQYVELINDSIKELDEMDDEFDDDDDDEDVTDIMEPILPSVKALLLAASKLLKNYHKTVAKISDVRLLCHENTIITAGTSLSNCCDGLVMASYMHDTQGIGTVKNEVLGLMDQCTKLLNIVKNLYNPDGYAPTADEDITQVILTAQQAENSETEGEDNDDDGEVGDGDDNGNGDGDGDGDAVSTEPDASSGLSETDTLREALAAATKPTSYPSWVGLLEMALTHNHTKFTKAFTLIQQ